MTQIMFKFAIRSLLFVFAIFALTFMFTHISVLGEWNPLDQGGTRADSFEYVMHGKIYRVNKQRYQCREWQRHGYHSKNTFETNIGDLDSLLLNNAPFWADTKL